MPETPQTCAILVLMRLDFLSPEFLRVRRNADGGLSLFPNQSSGVLTSVAWGDGLVDNPPGRAIAYGDPVDYLSFDSLLS